MWIARDKDGSLWLYTDKPIKGKDMWMCEHFFNSVCHEIGKIFPLPEITWENSPLELIIKPEESEDEKIRKNLITFFKEEYGTNSNARFAGIKVKDVIAWLEKQGEQPKGKEQVDNQNCVKPADNVEPKFHEGDWIVSEVTGSAYQIKYCVENLNTHKYGYDLTNGGYLGSYDANHYHLWTVQDAKDGDVLVASDNSIFIFSHCRDNDCVHHIALEVEDRTIDINYKLERGWETIRGVRPATKEQRDTLFNAMADAGYEFDFEKKVLEKIE